MTRTWVAVTGGIGLLVPLWTLGWYTGDDGFARALIALIVGGLLVGAVEMFRRARRIDGLLRELPRLDGSADGIEERLSQTSELFARLVRSRMRGEPAALPGVTLTPYLVSLLVLLGLLGTFVGLVETLAGAREALGSSSDVDALRAALLVPMRGLSRAFGTSVAGVSASALLGLALVLVRRSEGRVYTVLDERFSGPLAEATLIGRQIRALERLAEQADDLPRAVRDLAAVASRLPSLEESIAQRHEDVMRAVREAVEASARDVSEALGRGVERAAGAQQDAFSKVVDEAAAALTERAQGFASLLEEEARRRHEAEAARLEKLLAVEDERARALDQRLEEVAARELALVEQLTAKEDERARALEQHRAELAAKERERAEQLAKALEGATRLAEEAGAAVQDAASRLSSFEEDARAARAAEAGRLHEEVERWLAAAASGAAEERGALERLTASLDERQAGLEAAATERLQQLAGLLEGALTAQRQGHEELLARTHGVLDETGAKAQAQLEAVADKVARLAEEQLARERALEDELRAAREAAAEALAERLAGYAQETRDELAQATVTVREGADALLAGGIEMTALAERFADAVAAYKSANEEWLARLAHLEAARGERSEEDGEERLGEYLEQTREVFDRSLEMQRELHEGLRALRVNGEAVASDELEDEPREAEATLAEPGPAETPVDTRADEDVEPAAT